MKKDTIIADTIATVGLASLGGAVSAQPQTNEVC